MNVHGHVHVHVHVHVDIDDNVDLDVDVDANKTVLDTEIQRNYSFHYLPMAFLLLTCLLPLRNAILVVN